MGFTALRCLSHRWLGGGAEGGPGGEAGSTEGGPGGRDAPARSRSGRSAASSRRRGRGGGARPRVRSAQGAGRGGREDVRHARSRRRPLREAGGPGLPRPATWAPACAARPRPGRRGAARGAGPGGAGPGGGVAGLAPPAISRFARPADTFPSCPVLAGGPSPPEVTPPAWGPRSLPLPVSPSSRSHSPLSPAWMKDGAFCLHPSCLSRSFSPCL